MKSRTIQSLANALFIALLLKMPSAAISADSQGNMNRALSVPSNFACVMTEPTFFIGVFDNQTQYTWNTIMPSGERLESLGGTQIPINENEIIFDLGGTKLDFLTRWMLEQWHLEAPIKNETTDAYFIRTIFPRIEAWPRLPLIPPKNSRWIFILKKIPITELVENPNELGEVEQFMLNNAYYHLNFDATGAVCLHWPEESQFTPQDYVVFSTDEVVDDLKAIAAVYTPENGGENIPAGDIATLENALETDFGRSVLAELLQLHGDPREE